MTFFWLGFLPLLLEYSARHNLDIRGRSQTAMSNSSVCLNSTLPSLTGTCHRQMGYGVIREITLNRLRKTFKLSFAQFICSQSLSLQRGPVFLRQLFILTLTWTSGSSVKYTAYYSQNIVDYCSAQNIIVSVGRSTSAVSLSSQMGSTPWYIPALIWTCKHKHYTWLQLMIR